MESEESNTTEHLKSYMQEKVGNGSNDTAYDSILSNLRSESDVSELNSFIAYLKTK